MKQDFTQPFIKNRHSHAYILAEDSATGKFLLFRSADEDKENDGYYSEESYSVPDYYFDEPSGIARVVVKSLDSYGLVVSTIRELIRVTRVEYSFVNETPELYRMKYVFMSLSI
jgi:hypothetical protein